MDIGGIKNYNIILASKSPRRHWLLTKLGLTFETKTQNNVEEKYPDDLKAEEIPVYLSELKANAFIADLQDDELVITADTIVCLHGKILGKPRSREEAFEMIKNLSGSSHRVISGVCLMSKHKKISFSATTNVHFKPIDDSEINYYIDTYKPFDKAGAYGIQEWIGFIAIDHIEGSYFNVMGLPVQRLYEELKKF